MFSINAFITVNLFISILCRSYCMIDRIPLIHKIKTADVSGRVVSANGSFAYVRDMISPVGSRVIICSEFEHNSHRFGGEIIGFNDDHAVVMLERPSIGIAYGDIAMLCDPSTAIYPCEEWLGRVLNGVGEAIDHHTLPLGDTPYLRNRPSIPGYDRQPIHSPCTLGIKALDVFTPCYHGQRIGIFASPGAGKTTTLAQIARYNECDVVVLGLIGERNKELQDILHNHLPPEQRKKTVVVLAPSDSTPLHKIHAAHTSIAIAEYFRDQGKKVMCLLDSMTRLSYAMREVGIAAGEPSVIKGYTPMMFRELPRILERMGTSAGPGSITGLVTVLVENDDFDEPVSDTMRGLLDGHIILDKSIADRRRYPAIDICRSMSRMQDFTDIPHNIVKNLRKAEQIYDDMADMIRMGAYKHGSNAELDNAIAIHEKLEDFLSQDVNACFSRRETILRLLIDFPDLDHE